MKNLVSFHKYLKSSALFFSMLLQFGLQLYSVNNTYLVSSPNNLVKLSFTDDGGNLKYKVSRKNQVVIATSKLVILENVPVQIQDFKNGTNNSTWKTFFGQFIEIRDNHNELVLNLKLGHKICKLIAKGYNDKIVFRFDSDNINMVDKPILFC